MVWQHSLDSQLVMIGILPTVRDEDLTMGNISASKRYQALNDQVLRLREGRPLELDIHGHEVLRTQHMVAVSANSPYLFGKQLWDETRIPLFEQSVELGGYEPGAHGPMRRVTFGSGYVRESVFELFHENLEHYPVLLPMLFDSDISEMNHLRLHNGTLWRWNRPLIGIDENGYHLRIEHRVVPAGPSIIDGVANAAFYYGLAYFLSHRPTAPESQLPFEFARDNFYHAAQHGLDMQTLILDTLLPMAQRGLEQLNIDQRDIDLYLGTIETRTKNNCNGAAWQRAFVAKYGLNMQDLTKAYLEHQNSGVPVHDWSL